MTVKTKYAITIAMHSGWLNNLAPIKNCSRTNNLILPLGGDSDVGSESDDDMRLLEEATVTLPVGTGKL